MIRHFETRLADFLGTRLEPPLQGRVAVTPGLPAGTDPSVAVGVLSARPIQSDLGSRRPEVVPGDDDPRRVLRLECELEITIVPGDGGGRPQTIEALDALIYLLEAPELRRPAALSSPDDDPGFMLESMQISSVLTTPEQGIPRVEVVARGWFWPPEAPGVTGEPIAEARIRASQLPVLLTPWPLRLRPGMPPVGLTLDASAAGTMLVDADGAEAAPFGALALRLVDAGERPGAGMLEGGTPGPEGVRIVELVDGRATIDYAAPAEPAVDQLVVSVARPGDAGGVLVGIELARFVLVVEA